MSAPAAAAHGFDVHGMTACPIMPTYGPPPVLFVRGRGTELWDDAGQRYLDFLSGLAVTSLGHAHHTETKESFPCYFVFFQQAINAFIHMRRWLCTTYEQLLAGD